MNGKQLKNSILQWAIQGKLVPQNPKDEPASKLLERIAAQRVIASGAKQSKKNLASRIYREGSSWFEQVGSAQPKDITEEIPFDIPESWEWCRLRGVVSNRGQKTPTETFSYIDIGSIDNKKQKLNDKENLVDASKAPSRARKIVGLNDILYSTVRPYLHNMCIIDREFSAEPIASTGFAVMTCGEMLEYKYLFYYLLSPDFDSYANDGDNAKGVAYPAINDEKLYNALVPLPPLAEQKRIVKKLEQILPLVDEYDQAQTQLDKLNKELPEALKKSILQQAIQGKLVPQNPKDEPADKLLERINISRHSEHSEESSKKSRKSSSKNPVSRIYRDTDGLWYEQTGSSEPVNISEEIPFEIPETWTWCRWGEISNSIQYGFNAPAQTSGRIKMVRISDIQDNRILWEKVPFCQITDTEIDQYRLKKNDILFARTGGTVGKSYLMQDVAEEAVFAGYLIRTTYNYNLLVPQYLKIFMESSLYWSQLREGTIATAQPNCNGKTLGKMLIPLPPLAEQKRIVAKLEQLFKAL